MFNWFKKKKEVWPTAIDTSMDNQWLQLKHPIVGSMQFDGGYHHQGCDSMYIKFTSSLDYLDVHVMVKPESKLIFMKRIASTDYDSHSLSYNVKKGDLLRLYTPVTDKKLINKLECVAKDYYKSIETEETNRQELYKKQTRQLLKAALSHRCK